MLGLSFLFCLLEAAVFVVSQSHLRGIPLIRQSLYLESKDFTCLDGSYSIPSSYINDEFCDCLDGSDEPGTSACPNGTFYCENKGYVSQHIPSSRVNDGYCDCCDASDEYKSDQCKDICDVLGLEARLEAERLAQMLHQGSQIRLQMIADGKRIVQDRQARLSALESEKNEASLLVDEKETFKKEAEKHESSALEAFSAKEEAIKALKAQEEKELEQKEAHNIFLNFDSNKDDRLQIEEIRTRVIFDQNKDGVVSDDEVKFFFSSYAEVNLQEFLETVWPRLKPLYLLEKVKFIPPQQEVRNENEEKIDDNDSAIPTSDKTNLDLENPDENEETEEEEEDEEEPIDDDLKSSNESDGNAQSQYDEITAKIVADANRARSDYDEAVRVFQEVEREITQIKDSLAKDYGIENEFAPLDGQCFSLTDRDYIYKICPFDQVIQAGKSGGSETRLGSWAGWLDQDYLTMFYDKGQNCWNGPQRSAKVNVSCGLENEVLSAHEPNKCEYVLEFQTPAACRLPVKTKDTHDEL